MANIVIVGAGAMGTAFSFPCSDNNHAVSIIGTYLEDDLIDLINLKRRHPTLDIEVQKNVRFLKFNSLNEKIIQNVDLIVVAVISKGIEWASLELAKILKNKIPILILTKGLSTFNEKYEVLAHKMDRILKKNGVKETNISAAGGPCLARGLANKVHTSVIFANKDINTVKEISKMVSTTYYHISISSDVVGVETCAAIKNILSIAIGAAEGLSHPNASNNIKQKNYLNTAASLIQQSINEMIIFTEKINGKKESVMGLAGVGDLFVSAEGGRNSKMGKYLGQGMSFREAKKIKMPNDTIEGAELVFEIGKKIKKDFNNETLPLMNSITDAILDETPLKVNWKNFK